MKSSQQQSRLPPHGGQELLWTYNPQFQSRNVLGANLGFTYMFPVSKYNEATALGPTYISYYNYMHGHQPYSWNDQWIARQTPINPSHLALKKVVPKGSSQNIQAAQLQMSQMLAKRAQSQNWS